MSATSPPFSSFFWGRSWGLSWRFWPIACRGTSRLWRRRSACRACGTTLGPGDLIPLASFAWRRGRCRHCATAIPPCLLYAEILGLGAGVLAAAAGGEGVRIALSAAFLWLLLGLALTDLQWFRLPDPLTLATGLVALAMALHSPPGGLAADPAGALIGAGLGLGVGLGLRWGYRGLRGREGLGLGDVKLMTALGAFTGPLALPGLLLIAALTGLAGAAVTRHEGLGATRAIPFGAALALAAALMWLLARAGFALVPSPP